MSPTVPIHTPSASEISLKDWIEIPVSEAIMILRSSFIGYALLLTGACKLLTAKGCVLDIIMTCDWLYFGKQASRLWFEYRLLVVRACKSFDCLQRFKQVHRHKLSFIVGFLAQNVATVIARDVFQPRIDDFAQQALICIGILSFRPSSPNARNHIGSLFLITPCSAGECVMPLS